MKRLFVAILVFSLILTPANALLVPKTDVLYTGQDPTQAMAEISAQLPMEVYDDTTYGVTMEQVEALAQAINIFSKELLTEVIQKLNAVTGGEVYFSFTDSMWEVLGVTRYPYLGDTGDVSVQVVADEALLQETILHEFTHLFHAYFYYAQVDTEIHDTCVAENDGEWYMDDFLNDPDKQAVEWVFYQNALTKKHGRNYFIDNYAQTSEYEDLATIVATVGYTPVDAKTIFLQSEKDAILNKYQYFMSLLSSHFTQAAQSPLYQFNQLNHVPADWAKASIDYGVTQGVILPYMNHSYESAMTRADFCKAVVVALDTATSRDLLAETAQTPGDTFTDTKDPYILAAYALNIVSGTGNGSFNPRGSITRQEAAKMLTAAMEVLKPVEGAEHNYTDGATIAPWAVEGVKAVSTAGVMTGTGTGFSPLDTYSRQQAFVSIVRMYDFVKAA